MPGRRLLLAADHVDVAQTPCLMVETVYIHMVESQICRTQVTIISRHLHTVDMGSEIPFRNTPQPLVINLLRDLSGTAVFPQPEHRDLPVMIAAHEQESVFIVGGKIAPAHTVDTARIDDLEVTAWQDSVRFHTKIGNGIQKFLVMGNRNIGRIGDPHLILLGQPAVLQIHIINSDAVLVYLAHGVRGNVCHIFLLTHIQTMPFFEYRSLTLPAQIPRHMPGMRLGDQRGAYRQSVRFCRRSFLCY